jgi:methanogenic corrinoid protein MtbC1
MRALLDQGVAAREAARAVLTEPTSPTTARAADSTDSYALIFELQRALTDRIAAFDDAGTNELLDRLFAQYTVATVISEVIVPYLVELGERWSAGGATVAEEHFASSLIRGRLLGLARGWDSGSGSRALLACPSGERHDLGLLCFGLALRGHGWRITYLGADTPYETLIQTATKIRPDAIVLSATTSGRLSAGASALSAVEPARLAIAGRGATAKLAESLGATLLDDDPVTAARTLISSSRL